jgi:hypothetical protein
MNSEGENYTTRIVTIGMDDQGRSRVDSDCDGTVRYPSPVIVSTAVWEADAFPVQTGDDHTPDLRRYLPPPGGFRVFMSSFAPTKSWNVDATTRSRALHAAGLADVDDGRTPGFHQTPTVDIIVLVSGDIYVVLDEGEVHLQPGDTLIQQGAPHAWDNRSDHDAIVLCIMVDATA